MRGAALGIVTVLLARATVAGELPAPDPAAGIGDIDAVDRCDAIIGRVSQLYSLSFDRLVGLRVSRERLSAALAEDMRDRFAEAGMDEYGPLWLAHFDAVGNQLAPELIEGYLHYQCRSDTLARPITQVSDAIDAGCWDVADDGKMEILDARMNQKDPTDLKRISRQKILSCINEQLRRGADD